MNICFLKGKIISDIKFQFVLNSKNISIAVFEKQLENESIVKVKAYNEIADWCYRNLVKNDDIVIQGMMNSKMEIIIENINLC